MKGGEKGVRVEGAGLSWLGCMVGSGCGAGRMRKSIESVLYNNSTLIGSASLWQQGPPLVALTGFGFR